MTTLLERPRSRAKGGETVLSGRLPQINLLPPEVRAARGLRATKRWLGIGLIATLVVAIGLVALAKADEGSAQNELTTAQDQTARLQNAQKKYAEVPRVLSALGSAQTTRQLAMASDVQWKAYLDAISAVLPANVSISNYTLTVNTPAAGAIGQPGQVGAPTVGQIQFTGASLTVPDTAGWIDALNGVPGLRNAWVSATTVTAAADKTTYYTVSSTVDITSDAFTHRFDVPKGKG